MCGFIYHTYSSTPSLYCTLVMYSRTKQKIWIMTSQPSLQLNACFVSRVPTMMSLTDWIPGREFWNVDPSANSLLTSRSELHPNQAR